MNWQRLLHPGRWQLATQVIVLLLLLLAALLFVLLTSHDNARNDRREAEITNAVSLGQTTAGIFDGFAQDLETALSSEAVLLGTLDTIDQATAADTLRALLDEHGTLHALFVTDLDGRIIASANEDTLGTDLSDRAYIAALQDGAPRVWGQAVIGRESGRVAVNFGRPVYDSEGAPRAFLVAGVHPSALAERLEGRLPEGTDISFFDQAGVLLYSTSRPDLAMTQADFSNSMAVDHALSGGVARVDDEAVFFGGESRFGAVAPVPATGWAVAVTRPLAPLEATLQDQFEQQALRTTLTVLVLGGLIAFAISRIVRPLHDLADAADRMARGERPEIPDLGDRAEAGRLAQAMRTMSRAVAEREDALVSESARRSILAQVSRDFAHAGLDLDEQLDVTARRLTEFIGDGCMILLLLEDGSTLQPSYLHHRDLQAEDLGRTILLSNPVQVGEGLSGRVAATAQRRVLNLQDDVALAQSTLTEPHWEYFNGIGTHTLGAAPLVARGRVIGTLTIWRNQHPDPFTEDELTLLQEIAYRAALAIENAQLFRQAEEHAKSVERAMQSHDEIMAHVAHDLRNPLTTIRGTAQLLMRHARAERTPTPERLMTAMTSIDEAITRAMQEIDAALDVARMQMGQPLALTTAPVNIVELLRSITASQRRISPHHQIQLDAEIDELVGEWDAMRLDRAFRNLLDNAVKYSPEGGEVTVRVQHLDDGDEAFAVVSVTDQGIGIPESALGRVFDRFYRAENAGEIRGSGLGLSGVQHIITAHGGTIGVTSRPGHGSTFTVHLPRDVDRV